MSLPSKIKIGGFTWTIRKCLPTAEASECFGTTVYRSQTINIDPVPPLQKQEQTLLHEILHACIWQAGLSRRFKDEKVTEEEVVDALSNILYPTLKQLGFLKEP